VADVTYLDSQSLAKDGAPGSPGPPPTGPAGPASPTPGARTAHRPVGGTELTSGLLHDWQRRNREASLPLALRQLEVAGNLANMRQAAQAGLAPGRARFVRINRAPDAVHPAAAAEGADAAQAAGATAAPGTSGAAEPAQPVYHGPVFMDSDIYKTLEAIGWELARDPGSPDGETLARFAVDAVTLLENAQLPDGYLDSYIQVSGEPRYSRLASSHEMYCAGHLIQAAVAMRRTAPDSPAAGSLMAVARRLADHLVRTFGDREAGLDGHPVIETALAELYRETGQRDYLALAAQFVGQRGHGLAGDSGRGHRYLQDYLPIRETVTLEGHAVRAMYLEAGVVDVAVETGDEELLASSIGRWEDMVATKTYLTGGNGSRHSDESFGDRFELPPDRAYNETCAAIASFQWSWRLLLATGDVRYADLMERVLYNAFGASISTDGQRFFYVNPLQRRTDHVEGDDPGRRHEWFSCACCPPNIMRLLASLQHYLASTAGDTLYLHQFTGASLSVPLAGGTLGVAVSADFPWSGEATVRVTHAPGQGVRAGHPGALVEPGTTTADQRRAGHGRTGRPRLPRRRPGLAARRRAGLGLRHRAALGAPAPAHRRGTRVRGHRAGPAGLLPGAGRPAGRPRTGRARPGERNAAGRAPSHAGRIRPDGPRGCASGPGGSGLAAGPSIHVARPSVPGAGVRGI
jgi:DUF1680 family protein